MTAKQIFNLASKETSGRVSYQAIHKALCELEKGAVVEKQGNGYGLSLKWIEAQQQAIDAIKAKYLPSMQGLLGQGNMVFGSIAELDSFLIGTFLKLLHSRQDKPLLCLHWQHFWLPLFEKEDYLHSRELGKYSKAYCLARGNTAIDKWCAEFWAKNNVKAKEGIDIATTSDLIVLDDLIIEVFYPPEIKKLIGEVYNKTTSISGLNIDDLFEQVFQKKTRIPVIFNRNAMAAEQLKEQTLAFFK